MVFPIASAKVSILDNMNRCQILPNLTHAHQLQLGPSGSGIHVKHRSAMEGNTVGQLGDMSGPFTLLRFCCHFYLHFFWTTPQRRWNQMSVLSELLST